LTKQVSAIGFDLVSSNVYFPNSFGFPFSSAVATDAVFAFATKNGLVVQTRLASATFFGVVLIDDVFNGLSWNPIAECFCPRSVAIDNLAVKTVPEPSTLLLFGIAAGAIGVGTRKRSHRNW